MSQRSSSELYSLHIRATETGPVVMVYHLRNKQAPLSAYGKRGVTTVADCVTLRQHILRKKKKEYSIPQAPGV